MGLHPGCHDLPLVVRIDIVRTGIRTVDHKVHLIGVLNPHAKPKRTICPIKRPVGEIGLTNRVVLAGRNALDRPIRLELALGGGTGGVQIVAKVTVIVKSVRKDTDKLENFSNLRRVGHQIGQPNVLRIDYNLFNFIKFHRIPRQVFIFPSEGEPNVEEQLLKALVLKK